jgi:hypothetical protein
VPGKVAIGVISTGFALLLGVITWMVVSSLG